MKIFILLFSIFVMGCSNGAIKKTYYDNGKIESKIQYKDGKKAGKMISYFLNGKKAVKGTFTDDKRDKKWTFYNEKTGKIESIENYVLGVLQGEQFYYHENGKLKVKGHYENGVRSGFWEKYDEDGNLEVQNIFLDGENLISVAVYQKNSVLLCRGSVVDQMRQGKWEYFDSKGRLLYTVNYENGIRNGEWEAFERDGSLLMSGKYRDGKIIGIDFE